MKAFSTIAREILKKDPSFKVLPVKPNGKTTALKSEEQLEKEGRHNEKGGFHLARRTTDVHDFMRDLQIFYTNTPRKKQFNVGVTGDENTIQIDNDNLADLERIRLRPCWTEDTFTVKTPSGGFHFYWKVKKPLPKQYNGDSGLGPGFDTRNGGKGYVLAPGSEIDGKVYEVVNDAPLAEMPQALFDEITNEEIADGKPTGEKDGEKADNGGFEEGTRQSDLYKYGCYLVLKDLPDEKVKERVFKANRERCKPPLPEKEVRHTIKNALKKKRTGKGRGILIERGDTDQDTLKTALDTLSLSVRYNLRSERLEVYWADTEKAMQWRELKDRARYRLAFLIESTCRIEKWVKKKPKLENVKFPADAFRRALYAIADENEVDPFILWLESLPAWDGERRLDGLLTRYFQTDSPEVFVKWAAWGTIGGAIGRAYDPGRKQDEMPVLIGPQGIGKSTLWQLLLPNLDWYTDSLNLSEYHQKRVEGMLGNVIAECAELQGIKRTELNNLKAFMSSGTDKLRLAYRESNETIPRRVVLVGTTNNADCLPKDSTGNRRFIPIRVDGEPGTLAEKIREDLPEIREQLWAEGLERFRKNVASYFPSEHLELLQAETKQHEAVSETTNQAVTEGLERLIEQGALFGEDCNFMKLKQLTDEMMETNPNMTREREIGHSLRLIGCEKKRHRKHRAVWVVPREFINAHREVIRKTNESPF